MTRLHRYPLPRLALRLAWVLLAVGGLRAAEEAGPPAPDAPSIAAPDPAAESASLLRLATALADRAEYSAAEVAYRHVLTRRALAATGQREALLGLARLFRRQGSLTRAAAVYEKFLKEHPDDPRVPEALLELGRTQRAMGAHKLAIARFYSVINATLKIPETDHERYQRLARTAQFEIAETHFAAGNFAEAGKFFTRLRLLDLAPGDRARAHFKAAYAQHLAGDREGAVTTLTTFLDEWPDDEQAPEAAYLLATTLRLLGRMDESLAATHRLLQDAREHADRDPRRWAYWQRRTGNQLANDFFQSGHVASALGLYTSLAGLSDDPAWRLPVVYQVGLCHERLHDQVRAEAAYRTVIEGIAALGAAAPGDLQEFQHRAAWRLDHLRWQHQTALQVAHLTTKEPARPIHDTAANPPVPPETL